MEIKKTLTVFTPAYNRAYCLYLGYEALKRQTCKDFKWLIIDDGSTDNTKELVDIWISEEKIEIEYCYKENGGMHTAHNKAYELINTELNVCIDSDDYMSDDAVEKIVNFWRRHGSEKYAGIIGLDQAVGGGIIGTRFSKDRIDTTLSGFYREGGKGDKKLVYRTEVVKSYPEYPIFKGERYVGLAYKYSLIDQDYRLLVLDEVLCLVNYQTDGSSMNMYRQYWNNPKGFAFYRKSEMQLNPFYRRKFREAIHYVSSSIISKNKNFIKESPIKWLTVLAIPVGIVLYSLILYKVKRHTLMNKPK